MTADDPRDYDYVPAREPDDRAGRARYWRVAMGLQAVDGLTPSPYLRRLADGNIAGDFSLEETGALVRSYHRPGGDAEAAGVGDAHREADLVSQRIAELLSRGAFALVPSMPSIIHAALFQDLDADVYHPGEYKKVALVKQEAILNGDSVLYADPALVEPSLAYLFEEEAARSYGCEVRGGDLEAFARLIARLWQIHPFVEGNTRTVAVFSELYLAYLGFSVGNDPFERHARFFRDALVRANYRNAAARVLPDLAPLTAFYDSLLNGAAPDFSSEELRCQALFDDPSLLRNVSPSQALER